MNAAFEPRTNSVEHLYSLLTGRPDPVWLLGAGASAKSGVPLSEGIVSRAAKWEYCRAHALSVEDPRIKPSDFLAWLKAKPWYRDGSLADNYQATVRNLLSPRDNRREFFLNVLQTRIKASTGYQRMAEFMSRGLVRTVLTTNFDSVLPDHCRANSRPHHIDLIQTPSDYTKLRTDPRHPQYVFLHGSVEHYTDQNEAEETRTLDPVLMERLLPLLRDRPLIVVGYRGAELSIMEHLLANQAERVEFFRLGVYWCVVGYEDSQDLHPLVRDFARVIGSNFQVVPVEGFDDLMDRLWRRHQAGSMQLSSPIDVPERISSPATFDMEMLQSASLGDLDMTSARSRLLKYCAALDMPSPPRANEQWLCDLLVRLDLAIRLADKDVHPTRAGFLLFGKKTQRLIPSAVIRLRTLGEDRQVSGNLWAQLDTISDALAEFNRPFRLKGEVSEPVYPYPPLALKELIVNALVHRDYSSQEEIVIEIRRDRILITNPGGLVQEVLNQTAGATLQSRIAAGERGIKGYRNPALADLFYGAGAMDKKGSGLADVHRWAAANGSSVDIQLSTDNQTFSVALLSRIEAVDEQSGTAVPTHAPTRYAGNLLEVLKVPEQIFKANTTASGVRAIWEAAGHRWLPPFVLQGSEISSFHPFKTSGGKVAKPTSAKSLEATQEGERMLVWLLNENLYRHLRNLGLVVDKKRKRAYFPRTESGERPVAYQARLRRATRVVTKPIVSPNSQKIRYWEHKGFSFAFTRFECTWALHILPTYIFTKDGKYELLNGERVGSLATKRASRDYNNHVHNDLVFWSWVLARGENEPFCLQTQELLRPPGSQEKSPAERRRGRPAKRAETILPSADFSMASIMIAPSLASGVSNDRPPDPEFLDPVSDYSSDAFADIEEELTILAQETETEDDHAA